MTNTFRRHHKTIMWLIIVGTILSFVYYLTPNATRNPGGGNSFRAAPVGFIDGEPVSQPQYEVALREAMVVIRMREGQWPTPQEREQALPTIAFQQLYIAAKIKELNLEVPLEATALFTRKLFKVPAGQAFPKDKFEEFVKNELNERGKVTEDDFYHWVRDQVGVELLIKLYGMNGELITDKEAEFFFRRDHEQMTVELARFPLTNYISQIEPTAQEIGDFYTNRQANYRLPEREQLNYIFFNPSNYLAVADKVMEGMSNLDAQIDQAYASGGATNFVDAAGHQLSADAAKAKMKEEFRLQRLAMKAAQTNAVQLTELFFEEHMKGQAITNQLITKTELEKFAASNGLTVVTTPPFDQENPPKELQVPPISLNEIFRLKTAGSPAFAAEEIRDLPKLANRLRGQTDPVSAFLWQRVPNEGQAALTNYQPPAPSSNQVPAESSEQAQEAVVQALNKVLGEPCIYESARFKGVSLRPETMDLMKREPTGQVLAHLNRMLLEDAYAGELSRGQASDPEEQYKLVPATNGFFLVGLERVVPSENQPLEVVRAKVTEDYRTSRAKDLAGKAGAAFEAAVQAGQAKGQSFEEICAEQKTKQETLTPFSIETRSIPEIAEQDEFDYYIKRGAYEMAVGQISPFVKTETGGFVMCLKARTPVEESVVKRDLPAFLAKQREQRQFAAFSIWIGREIQTHVKMPSPKPAAGQAPPSSG